jgi:hypothetical protein
VSKVKCSSFQKLGHYSFNNPYRNEKEKKKHHARGTNVKENSKELRDEEFVF